MEVKKYIGIDIGGTFIKGMIIDGLGKIIVEDSISTPRGNDELIHDLNELIEKMITNAKMAKNDFVGVGIGCPGIIDSENGVVVFSGNLGMNNFPLIKKAEKTIKLPVRITNDANAAALGESRFGAGKAYRNSVLVTLGTGVGSGIVIDNKLYEGGSSAGAELGHMVIKEGGLHCTCGRFGCFEAYSSATALRKRTLEVMKEHPDSKMWDTYSLESVCGKTAFDYKDKDPYAREVVDWYLLHLGTGVTNIANIFRPDVIMIGGGVSNQRENLTGPVQEHVDRCLIGGNKYAPVKVITASLGDRAGVIGAAALFID